MKFVVEVNLGNRPAWWLVDDDNEVLAWAGSTFFSLAYADQAAHDFRVSADDPVYRIDAETSGRWRWTAWRSGDVKVAVSGASFSSRHKAHDAARRVQRQACTAIGP
jgi:hypothetical protein